MCEIIRCDPDREIDLDEALAELAAVAPAEENTERGNGADNTAGERADWAELIANIIAGRDLHLSTNRLASSCAGRGYPQTAPADMIRALLLQAPRDDRWQTRFDDIGRSVRTAYENFAEPEQPNGPAPSPEPPEPPQPEWPALDAAALHGLAGDLVRTIEPHSEADPTALLVQFLAAFGSAAGNGPFYQVESDRHRGNLFAVLCGESSKARKGLSWGRIRHVMTCADNTWTGSRVLSGLSSGEGLIQEVRDERLEWNEKEQREVVVDAGVADKRLLVIEPEFARTVTSAARSGNILSGVLRQAWDSGQLATLTKNSPLKATGAHISVVGHITVAELRSVLTSTDVLNGYANRFLFILVRRSKLLAFGGDLDEAEVTSLGYRVKHSLVRARGIGRIGWTSDAAAEWRGIYEELSRATPGLAGAATARGEAQCVRLAMLYALLDEVSMIDIPHLKAAVALWRYAEASARYVFGGVLGDPIADEILAALLMAKEGGMARTEIHDLFSRNASAGRIGAAMALLQQTGKARREERRGSKGRPTEMWVAC